MAEVVVGSSLALHTSLLVPFTGSTGPVVDLYGLAESGKGCMHAKTNLAIYSHMLGVSGQCSSEVLMLSYELDISSRWVSQVQSHVYANISIVHSQLFIQTSTKYYTALYMLLGIKQLL